MHTMVQTIITLPLAERLVAGARVLEAIDAGRVVARDPEFHMDFERAIVGREIRDLERQERRNAK